MRILALVRGSLGLSRKPRATQSFSTGWQPRTSSHDREVEGTTILTFVGGERLVVPPDVGDMDDESWYTHWYATRGRRAGSIE